MKIIKTSGYNQVVNLTKNKEKRKSASALHINVRCVLKELFPRLNIYEEIFIDGLYLDFFIKELALVIEVDGEQHEKYIHFYHKNAARYQQAISNDIKKEYLCEINNFRLIRINHKIAKNKNKIKNFIMEKFNE